MAAEPPTRSIPVRGGVLGKKAAGAGLVGGAEVVVFGFIAFEWGRKKLIDGDRRKPAAFELADVKHAKVERVDDGDRDEEILDGLFDDWHG